MKRTCTPFPYLFVIGLFFGFTVSGSIAQASEARRSQMGFGGGYSYFKGNIPDTLAGDPGYVLRFQAEMGRNSFFRIFGNFTTTIAKGSATFSDGGNEINLSYFMLAGEFNIGAAIVPLVFLKRSIVQPYIGGFGSGHLNNMKFSGTVPDTFPKSENGLYYGWGYQAGVNFYIGKSNGLQLCFEQNIISGKVDGTKFKLGSLRFILSWIVF